MSNPILARGDIVVAAFPYTDLSMQKRRPALVLNENTEQGDVILAFIGTQIPPQLSPTVVMLESTDSEFSQTGLKTDSFIRLDKIATI
jgi:mRNA interferase MazF